MRRPVAYAAAAVVLALGLVVAGAFLSGQLTGASDLEGSWRLTALRVDGASVALGAGREITLVSDGRGSSRGRAPCNGYSTDGDRGGRLGEVGSDATACLGRGVQTLEDTYLDALGRADHAEAHDGVLVLTGSGVRLEYAAVRAGAAAARARTR